ncbi:M60 family metallopeptidase [Bacillus cytotoxicus]|uniref:S-layer domain protein n=1 Tax=Bacillus cytotoxicus (strain DSM 22905 / CIP 110041 / 391-98 / NVH 391-98) TaxID=315749 RepID=A7GU48_BACCN|nr:MULTISPECIES: M60 family metallopeptidase [Bacillus cereus group]ABS23656.1 S-layer domain protein [Bacillus cytotoxicus NVH 391-98]AWC46269.1 S-layer protein [Bacillus cytotoxicus]MDH2865922.1 M60 family metallopeptidase [Bacillus cytotoxicus]MDH2885861.1 M60 family metallopeptidase [Bacillus cytotoxicus]MDH2889196.1 M60 family metallopeptidase [Bacillus cytotoxicus]
MKKSKKKYGAMTYKTLLAINILWVPFASGTFEVTKAAAESIENIETTLEERTFLLKGKGNVDHLANIHQRAFAFSPFEPTGLYAKPNETIIIHVEGKQNIQAYIGTYSYDGNPKKFYLKPGKNEISAPKGGMLYFENANLNGETKVTVSSGGTPIPYFELGKHTKEDWDAMLEKFPNAYAVELKGERSLFTVTYKAAKQYLGGKDPSPLLRKHDEAIRIQDKVSGVSEEYTGVAQADTHYVHFVEDFNKKDGWMYATNYRTGYVSDAMKYVLDLEHFEKDGWGPWHEAGHQRQQTWKWSGLTEVTVNIYSMAVQRAFGNPSRLEAEERYNDIFLYLMKPQSEKNYDQIDNLFVKLGMFWQLDLAFGDNFYPKLHQMYRLTSLEELGDGSDEEKKQLFITMASKVANRDLTPFFEIWGLMPSEKTKNRIKHLPKLQKEIWKGRDLRPVVEERVSKYQVPMGGIPVPTTVDIGAINDIDVTKLVTNLSPNVYLTGNRSIDMRQFDSASVTVEIADKEGNKNAVIVPMKVTYGDSIVFQGLSDWNSAIISISHANRQLKAITTDVTKTIHYRFPETYYSFKVYDKDTRQEKLSVSTSGQVGAKDFVSKIQNVKFNYGDIVEVFHSEPSRLHVYHNNEKVPQDKQTTKQYIITPKGFQDPQDVDLAVIDNKEKEKKDESEVIDNKQKEKKDEPEVIDNTKNKKKDDISGKWYEHEIRELAKKGIMAGDGKGSYWPERLVTRAEFAALIARALQLSEGTSNFKDLGLAHPSLVDGINRAAAAGIIHGRGNGIFAPNDTITREEVVIMVDRALQSKGITGALKEVPFIDQDAAYDKKALQRVYGLGIVKGNDQNQFLPKGTASRAEAAAFLNRMLRVIDEEK